MTKSHTRAYSNYASALKPRWGGSREQQLQMARLCLDSGAAKNRVKMFSGYFITSISEQVGQLRMNDSELNDLAIEFATHLSELTPELAIRTVHWSHLPAIARILHDHNEFDALRKLLLTAPNALYAQEFENQYLSLPLLQSYVSLDPSAASDQQQRLWNHLYQSLITSAHTLAVDDVTKCLEQLESVRELDEGETEFAFRTFKQIADTLKSFHQGEEIQLSYEGNEHFWVGRFLPRYPVAGGFGYEVSINNHHGHLVSLIRFPIPFSVEATLTSHKNVADPFGAAILVGPHQDIYGLTDQSNGAVVRYCREDRDDPADSYLLFDRMPDNAFGMYGQHFRPLSMGDHMSHRCRLEVRADRIDTYVGKARLPGASIQEKIKVHGIVQFGRLCNGTTNERLGRSKHSITDIMIKKLD